MTDFRALLREAIDKARLPNGKSETSNQQIRELHNERTIAEDETRSFVRECIGIHDERIKSAILAAAADGRSKTEYKFTCPAPSWRLAEYLDEALETLLGNDVGVSVSALVDIADMPCFAGSMLTTTKTTFTLTFEWNAAARD